MSLRVVPDRGLRTRTSNHDLFKIFSGFFATEEPILGVLGLSFKIATSVKPRTGTQNA